MLHVALCLLSYYVLVLLGSRYSTSWSGAPQYSRIFAKSQAGAQISIFLLQRNPPPSKIQSKQTAILTASLATKGYHCQTVQTKSHRICHFINNHTNTKPQGENNEWPNNNICTIAPCVVACCCHWPSTRRAARVVVVHSTGRPGVLLLLLPYILTPWASVSMAAARGVSAST